MPTTDTPPFACHNHLCGNHFQLPKNLQDSRDFYVIDDGDKILVQRFLYKSDGGQTRFYLCEVCREAVELVTGGQKP